jgi:8-oxo-dGTP pyrophosphatase MutT (NUDIX family)
VNIGYPVAVVGQGMDSEESAGGVLWRAAGRDVEICDVEICDVEICLIATRGGTRWQLPKGHPARGETLAEAARREVREETGCDGDVEDELGEIVFWFYVGAGGRRRRVRKTVHFFLLRYQRGETRNHDGEVDDAVWLAAGAAVERLTFESERQVLVRALERLRGRP